MFLFLVNKNKLNAKYVNGNEDQQYGVFTKMLNEGVLLSLKNKKYWKNHVGQLYLIIYLRRYEEYYFFVLCQICLQ